MSSERWPRVLRALIGLSLYGLAAPASEHNITRELKDSIRPLFNLSETAEDTVKSTAKVAVAFMAGYLIAFFILRPLIPRVYLLRRLTGDVVYKPERWLHNMLWISSDEAFSAGISMDGCMHILAWTFALRVGFGLLLVMPLPLLVNWHGAGFQCPGSTKEYYTVGDSTDRIRCGKGVDSDGKEYSPFVRLTMAAFEAQNLLAWGHIVTLWLITLIVVVELKRANKVFANLRSKWLLQRAEPVASSVMGLNVTARSDKEFRDLFEDMFPGKVVDARLVKFCEPLTKTCIDLEKLEDKIKIQEIKAAAKEKRHQGGGTEQTPDAEEADQPPGEDEPTRSNKRGPPVTLKKIVKATARLISPELKLEHEKLAARKKEQQQDLVDRMVKRTQEVEMLRQEEETLLKKTKGQENAALMAPLDAIDARKALVALKGIIPGKNDEVFSRIGFVTFTDIHTATLAVQASYSNDPRFWQMSMAPDPKDVLWNDIATKRKSANQELKYVIIVASVAIFVLWSAMVAVVQRYIDKLFEMWVKSLGTAPTAFIGFLQGVVSTLALVVFLSILPKIVYRLVVISGRMVKNVAYLDLQSFVVLFKVVFIIYATSLGKPMEELGRQIFKGSPSTTFQSFDVKSTFGTSVPSEFPKHFAFSAGFLVVYSSALLQQDVYIAVALQYFLFRMPLDYAWKLGRQESTPPMTNPRRFISLTVLMTICLMIYQVAPLNILLFLVLFFLGGASLRYRVLYTDNGLVDSGGLYWMHFSSHVIVALIVVQISACVVLTSILQGLGTVIATVPLPVWCYFFSKRIKETRWKFITLQDSNTRTPNIDDIEKGRADLYFPYVQPQLADASSEEAKDDVSAAKETAMNEKELKGDTGNDEVVSESPSSRTGGESDGSKQIKCGTRKAGSPSFKKTKQRGQVLSGLEQGTARQRRNSASSPSKEFDGLRVAGGEVDEAQRAQGQREVSPE